MYRFCRPSARRAIPKRTVHLQDIKPSHISTGKIKAIPLKNMTKSIGQSVTRLDARDKATGAALYSGDLVRPDMLYMKTLFAGHPHARVLHIDTSQALALPGVVAIYTA